jgi:hypothetical protein
VKTAGVLGLIGAMLTLAVGVYLVLLWGVVSGFTSAMTVRQTVTPVSVEPWIPSPAPGVVMIAAAASVLPFASVLIVGRGARLSGTVLALGGVVAAIAQSVFASNMSGSERVLFTLIQPAILIVVGGAIALTKTGGRQLPHSA